MEKVLFVSTRLNKNNKNGAYIVSKRNFDIISSLYETDLFLIEDKRRGLFFEIFGKRMESIKRKDEEKIIKILKEGNYKYVFYDTSLFGYLAEKIKKQCHSINNIIFCHDISKHLYETIFNQDLQNSKIHLLKRIKRKIFLINIEKNEKKSFKNADKIITLNNRETKVLKQMYNYSADIEIPISIEDRYFSDLENIFNKKEKNFIFVGVADFFPNIQGIRFFIKEVLPYVNIKLYIIGRNMEKYKAEFEMINSRIVVLGTVDDLSKYYFSCDAVIAPIFSGGGMKVKTAEALMYGKTIFGTKEAFEGYDIEFKKIGALCNNSEEFIREIKEFCEKKNNNNNKYSRETFLNKYSYEASKEKFMNIFESLGGK